MGRTRGIVFSAYVFALFCGSGCVAKKQLLWDAPTNRSYKSETRNWTRTDQIFDGIINRSTVQVTCFSPTFARILEQERAQRARLDSDTARIRLKDAVEKAKEELVFFVALHTQNHFWNDLARKKPTFTVKLYVDGGTMQTPTSITRLGENQMADWSTLFPEVTALDTGYFVTFKAPEPSKEVRLLISGDPGAMEMRWKIKP